MSLPKTYEVIAQVGARSSTGDPEGEIVATGVLPADPLPLPCGRIRQRPPAHSAVHVDGERVYRRARRGETVLTPEREVEIYSCEQLWREPERCALRVVCSSGTYIRSLVADLGDAYCLALRRTAIGLFGLTRRLAGGGAARAGRAARGLGADRADRGARARAGARCRAWAQRAERAGRRHGAVDRRRRRAGGARRGQRGRLAPDRGVAQVSSRESITILGRGRTRRRVDAHSQQEPDRCEPLRGRASQRGSRRGGRAGEAHRASRRSPWCALCRGRHLRRRPPRPPRRDRRRRPRADLRAPSGRGCRSGAHLAGRRRRCRSRPRSMPRWASRSWW